MKRITVIMPDEVYDKVIALAKKEKRKKSPMAAILIEYGLKMAEPSTYDMINAATNQVNSIMNK